MYAGASARRIPIRTPAVAATGSGRAGELAAGIGLREEREMGLSGSLDDAFPAHHGRAAFRPPRIPLRRRSRRRSTGGGRRDRPH